MKKENAVEECDAIAMQNEIVDDIKKNIPINENVNSEDKSFL